VAEEAYVEGTASTYPEPEVSDLSSGYFPGLCNNTFADKRMNIYGI
jgi:hypothetical protein